MTENTLFIAIGVGLVVFYAFLIWHAWKHGQSKAIYVLLALGNVAVAMYFWDVTSHQTTNDPQWAMGLGAFIIGCAAISALLPFIAFLVFLFRQFRR